MEENAGDTEAQLTNLNLGIDEVWMIISSYACCNI